LEFWADGGDERREQFGDALVDVCVGRGNGQQQLDGQREGRFDVAPEHWAAGVGDEGERVQSPQLHHGRGQVLGQRQQDADARVQVLARTEAAHVSARLKPKTAATAKDIGKNCIPSLKFQLGNKIFYKKVPKPKKSNIVFWGS